MTTDFTVPLDDRLQQNGFQSDRLFSYTREDDVYKTIVDQLIDGTWLAVIHNLSPDAMDPPPKFRFRHDGVLLSTEGIDPDTARTLYPELLRPSHDFMPLTDLLCRHCEAPIRRVGATWVHRDTDSILCNGNIPIATPKEG